MIATLLVLGCASCGSGGDSPLILYPNERAKAYIGETHQQGFRTVTSTGAVGSDMGPQARDTLTFAGGATFLTDGFATVTVPYVTNARDGRSVSGTGDPLVSTSWTVLPASMLTPAKPQVQVLAAYKRAVSRSAHNTKDDNLLDAIGSGFDEARTGVDFWWGASTWKAGFAAVAMMPTARTYDGVTIKPGNAVRGTVTTGYGFGEAGKAIVGAVVQRHGLITVDGTQPKSSAMATNNLFVGADAMVSARQTLRLTLTRAAAFGKNRNATEASGVTVAWMGAL